MQACAEDLPLEVWLLVFQYLEAHDLFRAFQNLNSSFDQILASSHLSLFVRLKETDGNHLQHPNNPFWSDSALNRIICLRSVLQSRSNYFLEFLRWHTKKLIRLQSLSIITRPRDTLSIPCLCQPLKGFDRLECLSLTCAPHQTLFETIFTLPTLRVCRLILRETIVPINHLSCENSPVKQLFLVFLARIEYPLVDLLLTHTPELKRLEISGSSYSFDPISLFVEPLFTLPELRILKLQLEGGYFTFDCFASLRIIMPALKSFYFHYTKHILSQIFLDQFITQWWPIIEPIQHFDIYIKGRIFIDELYLDTQMNYQQNRRVLLEKINRSSEFSKFEWIQQDLSKLRLEEITIIKR